MTTIPAIPRMAAALLAGALILGCGGGTGPELASVTGTVTLDGQPLPEALVTFQPKAGGRASMGRTDAEGYYELIYSRSKSGALVGEHTVSISTYLTRRRNLMPKAKPPKASPRKCRPNTMSTPN